MATRYVDREQPCTHCRGPVQTIITDTIDYGSPHASQVYGARHAEPSHRDGVDDACTREPRG